ncbi:MAG: hypothetical protein AAB836_01195 [Patescibacteria group bacterium]
MNNYEFKLTGRIDGHLTYGKPIPAVFHLNRERISPEILPKIGMLLESFRLGDGENIIKSQIKDLHQMGAHPNLVETFLKTRMEVKLSIQNGAGSAYIADNIMRFLKESALKGDHVSTYGEDQVISAGAYMWMSAPNRRTRESTKYLWHTRTPSPGGATEADKAEDLQIFRPFFEGAKEPLRSRFLHEIDKDDEGSHEITTTGGVLIRAGLAERFE